MVTKMRILTLGLLGLSFWFMSDQSAQKSIPSRGPASQEDFELRETFDDEETDYYDSYQFRRGEPVNPVKADNSRPEEERSNKKMKKKKSKDPIGDDVEWSQLQLCNLGNASSCYQIGKSLLNSQPLKATQLIAKACHLRDFTACEETGRILKITSGAEAAISYFKSACDNASYAEGCYETASFLESRGSASIDKISNYYRIACLEGNATSCERLESIRL